MSTLRELWDSHLGTRYGGGEMGDQITQRGYDFPTDLDAPLSESGGTGRQALQGLLSRAPQGFDFGNPDATYDPAWLTPSPGGDRWGGLPIFLAAAGVAGFNGGFALPDVTPVSASSLGGSAVSEAAASGFSMPAGVDGLGAFAVEGGGSAEGLTQALQGPIDYGASTLNAPYSTPGVSTGALSTPATTYGAGALGGGAPSILTPLETPTGLLDGAWNKAKDFFTDPTTRAGMQAAQLGSKLIGSDGGDTQAKQQGSQAGFYASLASLISSALQSRGGSSGSSTPTFNSTYNASQAVAPDQRSSFLHGSSGSPSTQAFTMEKGAPTAIPALGSSATGGTPTAPTMPSQGQGAIRMRRKMYA